MTPPKAFEILGLDINTVQHDDVHTAYAKKVAEADGPFKALTLRKLEHARNQALKMFPNEQRALAAKAMAAVPSAAKPSGCKGCFGCPNANKASTAPADPFEFDAPSGGGYPF